MESQHQDESSGLSAEVAARLEIQTLYTEVNEAHNRRNFDHNSPPWSTSMAPGLKCKIAYGDRRYVDLDGYLEQGKVIFGDNPFLSVELIDTSVALDLKHGTATLFANQALKSSETGLARKSVMIADLVLMERRWVVVGFKHIKGDGLA